MGAQAIRQESLEQLAFVVLDTDEQADYGTGPWLKYNEPPRPIVAYVDLNWGLPDLTHVWEQLKQTQGFLLAFATGLPSDMDTWLEAEGLLLKSKPVGMSHSRFFLRAAPLIGWATILRFPDESPPAVVQRLLISDACKEGCLLTLPALAAPDKQMDRSGNDIFPQQRGVAFHFAILRSLGIMGQLMASGTVPMDFYLMEPESGTATLANAIATTAEKRSRIATGASDAPRARTYSFQKERNNKNVLISYLLIFFVCVFFCVFVLSFFCKF